MQFTFNHTNLNVTDLGRSIRFYEEALGLKVLRKKERPGFTLAFLGDGVTDYQLELTCLKDHPQPYELGENETHVCFHVDDYDSAHAKHQAMGCICFENTEMGLYFIEDPDGYWFEIVPDKR